MAKKVEKGRRNIEKTKSLPMQKVNERIKKS
jgi:hypothetical protein